MAPAEQGCPRRFPIQSLAMVLYYILASADWAKGGHLTKGKQSIGLSASCEDA